MRRLFSVTLLALATSIPAVLTLSVASASAHSEPVNASPETCMTVDSEDQMIIVRSYEAAVDGTLVTE